jgi:hypothetical protein
MLALGMSRQKAGIRGTSAKTTTTVLPNVVVCGRRSVHKFLRERKTLFAETRDHYTDGTVVERSIKRMSVY